MIAYIMAHAAIFLKIIALPFGVVALIRIFQDYRKYNHKYLQIYGYLVSFTYLIVVLSLGLFYIFSNLFPRLYSQAAIVVETVYCFMTSIAFILIGGCYILLSRHLLQKPEPAKYNRILKTAGGLLSVIVMLYSVYSVAGADVWPISNLSVALILLVNWFNIGVIMFMLWDSRHLPDKGKQTAVQWFAGVILIPYVPGMVLFLLHVLGYVDTYISNVVMFFYQVALALLPVLYLKKFMELYHGAFETVAPGKDDRLERLFQKYALTKREREIIQLICEGKTNKQIEAHLYISILTVKEHITNIYKKTGVKNRVQLNNFFRDSSNQLF